MKKLKSVVVIAMLCLCAVNAHAEKVNQEYLAVKITTGKSIYEGAHMNFGLLYEQQFAKHFAYNYGLDYRQCYVYNAGVRSLNYISVPANIKFISKYINVGIGLNANFMVGATAMKDYTLTSFDSNVFAVGAALQISKSIVLSKYFECEPEISGGPLVLGDDYNWEFNVGVKFKYRIQND